MMKYLILILYLFGKGFAANSSRCSIQACNQIDQCLIVNFKQFNDLKFDCHDDYKIIQVALIKPLNPLVLNDNLNFSNFVLTKNKKLNTAKLVLTNIDGFELNSNPFKTLTSLKSSNIFYQFGLTRFSFVYNSVNINLLSNFSNLNPKIFSGDISYVIFVDEIFYSKKIPNIVFKNSYITHFEFFRLENSLVSNNYPTFDQICDDANSTIEKLIITTFNTKIDDKFLNKEIFKRTIVLDISHILNEIQTFIFKSFDEIKIIDIKLLNLKAFLYKGLKWANYLNKDINIDIRNYPMPIALKYLIYVYFGVPFVYDFPDEDICIFSEWPFKQLVLPYTWNKKITCTFAWIMQYYQYYDYQFNIFTAQYVAHRFDFIKTSLSKASFFERSSLCQFEKLLENCKINQINYNEMKDTEKRYYFANFLKENILREFLNYIVSIILLPIVCICGVLLNALIVLVLNNRNFKKDFKLKLFKSMNFYSLINILTCFIYLFELITKCIKPSGIYCPIIRRSIPAQYFYMIVINYIGSSLKICSNVINITISFNRLMMISESKHFIFIKLYNSKIHLDIILILILSFSINIIKFFQYEIPGNDLYFGVLDTFIIKKYVQYPFLNLNFNSLNFWYIYINAFVYFIDNIFCSLVTILIDIVLIVYIRRSMKTKTLNRTKNKKDIIEFKLNVMVITNCIFLIITHCLEFIFSILSILSSFYGKDLLKNTIFNCGDVNSYDCVFSEDFAKLLYFSYYLFPFFSFYFFNKKFKESFRNLFRFKDIILKRYQ